MALSRAKYRRLPELYVAGTELVLKDGAVMWLQVLNPFQTEEARHDAQVARSRLVMALKEHGSAEMAFVEAALWQDGEAGARARLVEDKCNEAIAKIVNDIRDDPDWKERLDIMDRSDDTATLEDSEKALLTEIQLAYVGAIQKAMDSERDYFTSKYSDADRQTLLDEYSKIYIDRRGAELATAEYRVVEIWYGARVCEGTHDESGTWDHSACEGHQVQVFESKAEVRQLPTDLSDLLSTAYDELSMSIRDAKDLDRLASSSDSSRQPSAAEESTPSTQEATPSAPPGTSPKPSLTPSAS